MLFKSLQSISIKSNSQRVQLTSSIGLTQQSSNTVTLVNADAHVQVNAAPLLTANVDAKATL